MMPGLAGIGINAKTCARNDDGPLTSEQNQGVLHTSQTVLRANPAFLHTDQQELCGICSNPVYFAHEQVVKHQNMSKNRGLRSDFKENQPGGEQKIGVLLTGITVAAILWFYMFSPWTSQISNFWLNMTVSAVILSIIAICGLRSGGALKDIAHGPHNRGDSGAFADGQASKGCVGLMLSDGEPLRIFGSELRWRWLDGIIGGERQDDGTIAGRQAFWKKTVTQVVIGLAVAFALWGVFWIGDKISQLIFDFARGQVDNVYGMKSGVSPALITVLLLFLIGPAEEFFWRGFVQRTMSEKIGATAAMFVTVVIYALVHIWSFNFMLVMAALAAGAVWGFIYRLRPSLLPALIISHALWDVLVFVLLPI